MKIAHWNEPEEQFGHKEEKRWQVIIDIPNMKESDYFTDNTKIGSYGMSFVGATDLKNADKLLLFCKISEELA